GDDPRGRGSGRYRPVPAQRDARGARSGLRAHGARQGAPGAARPARARAAQRPAPLDHAVRAGVPLPPHRRGAPRVGVRLARHGLVVRDGDRPAGLPRGHGDRARGGRDGHARQPARRRAVRGGGPARPGARRMTVGTWLALAGALVVALVVGAEARRAAAGPVGRRFFRHPTAAPGLVVLAFFVTLALAAPVIAPYPWYLQLDPVHLA